MSPKYRKWLFLAIVALIPILSGCDGCDKKKYVAPPPAPSAPSNLTGTAVSSTQIDLSWKDNSTNEKGFHLYRRTTNSYARVAILEANANSYNDTGLDPETSYWYKVRAYNDGGESGSSNEVNITTTPGPEPEPEPGLQAPTNLTATAVSYKQINLSWQDNSTNEEYFKVYHPPYCQIATLMPNTTSFEHRNLQPMEEYEYYVCAYSLEVEGRACSDTASATTPCPVAITDSWISAGPPGGPEPLCVNLRNDAAEPCQVELTARFFYASGEEVEVLKEIFDIGAWARGHFEIPLGFFFSCYTVKVTDVEIEY